MSINVLNTPESVVSLVTPKLKITGNSGTPKLDLLTNFFEGLTTEEQSGDLVSFENTVGLPFPFVSVKADITAQQDLHGQANPYPAGGGINKFDKTAVTSGSYLSDSGSIISNSSYSYTDYIPVVGGNSYYFLNPTGDAPSVCIYDSSKAFISGIKYSILRGGSYNRVLPIPSNGAYIRASVANTHLDDFGINYPSTDHDYHPYSNICPITGFTGANIYDDPKYDKTIYWNQLAEINVGTGGGITITQGDDGVATLSGTASGSSKPLMPTNITHISGHKYLMMFSLLANPNNLTFTLGMGSGDPWISSINQIKSYNRIYTNAYTTRLSFYDIAGKNMTGVKFTLWICDLTAMFGAGNEPTIDEFKALFPKDYYAYNTGETSLVSKVNGEPYREVAIPFGSTVYGGTLNVTTGVLTITYGIKDFGDLSWYYNGTQQTFYANISDIYARQSGEENRAICSAYASENVWGANLLSNNHFFIRGDISRIYVKDTNYTDGNTFKSAMTGQKIVYELATPTEVQLTPTEVKTLLGQNNIWADTGEVEVTYYTRG